MAVPSTTVVPFGSWPSCAFNCGPLHDANGACVPPAQPTASEAVYAACFCDYGALQPFSSTPAGVCDAACPQDPAVTTSIQQWFSSYCENVPGEASPSGSPSGSPNSGADSGPGGTWMSTHYQWVIMIVIVIVGIIGIWVGACIWRRKYLRKRNRMYELGKGLPSSVAVNTQGNLVGPGGTRGSSYSNQPGAFMSGTGEPKPNPPTA